MHMHDNIALVYWHVLEPQKLLVTELQINVYSTQEWTTIDTTWEWKGNPEGKKETKRAWKENENVMRQQEQNKAI